MALSYVGGTFGSGTGTTYTVSLTSLTGGSNSAPQTGDLVVVFTGYGNGTGGTSSTGCSGDNSGAYTAAHAAQVVADSWRTFEQAFYFRMGATPDTSLTIFRVNTSAYGGATTVQVWRGADATTPMDVTPVVATGLNTATINPASITPVTAGAVIIAGGCGTQPSGSTNTYTASSDMINAVSTSLNATIAGMGTVMASKAWTSGAYDPAAVTGGGTNTSCCWAATTLAIRPAAATAYTLTLDPSSYTDTGSNGTLYANRNLPSNSSSYTLTGSAATLTKAEYLTASPASYTLTGFDASFYRSLVTQATSSSYSVTGQDTSLTSSHFLTASPEVYNLNGTAANLHADFSESAVAGTFWITGSDASYELIRHYQFNCSPDSYLITDSNNNLYPSYNLVANSSSYSITGQDSSLLETRILSADPLSYPINGSTATLTYASSIRHIELIADPNAYTYATTWTLTGFDADLHAPTHTIFVAGVEHYIITGQDTAPNPATYFYVDSGSFIINGFDAVLNRTQVYLTDPSSYSILGYDAILIKDIPLLASIASYVLQGANNRFTLDVESASIVSTSENSFRIEISQGQLVKILSDKTCLLL